MDHQRVVELTTDQEGRPELKTTTVEFRRGDGMMTEPTPGISAPEACKSVVYVELPVGFSRSNRISDRDQIVVCLSGTLQISVDETNSTMIKPGNVFRIPVAETSEHELSVVGEEAVRLMIVYK